MIINVLDYISICHDVFYSINYVSSIVQINYINLPLHWLSYVQATTATAYTEHNWPGSKFVKW